ncbi:SPFH domain-containing protein [bacterium]|nr:MAG: SPFH domain-containing protein [bacterium]
MELIIIPIIILILVFIFIPSILFTVEQQTAAVIERFGKFVRIATAGLNWKIPLVEKKAGKLSFRVQELNVKAETKTLDNVFVHLTTSVQFFVIPQKAADAFYKLNDPARQINSYVYDVIRAKVPKMTLDQLFDNKDEIALAVKKELEETMTQFGFGIVNALVTDIEPDAKVKESMNEINSAQRLRIAAAEKGEAERILLVKRAEAEAQSKALQGKGIADQRRAIIQGLKDSVEEFQSSVHGSTAKDVMNLVLMTQYFDTLKEISMSSKTNTIMLPHSPSGMNDIASQIRDSMISANEVGRLEK